MKNVRFEMKISDELIGHVDRWRANQPGVPNRSEAIRRLIEAGLNATAATAVASPGRTDQAAKTPLAPGSPDQAAESGTSKPRHPRAKPLLMSKEAQIRALRERAGG